MPATLPLELALLVVDFALVRGKDEKKLEQRRRLRPLSYVCKAFHKAVRPTLNTRPIFFKGRQRSSINKLEEVARAGTFADVSVVCGIPDDPFDVVRANGQAIKTLVHKGRLGRAARLSTIPRALEELKLLFLVCIKPSPRQNTDSLAINQLSLLSPLPARVILDFLRPALTPNLRSLALLDAHRFEENAATLLLAAAASFSRLDFVQLHYERPSDTSLSALGQVVPTLGCGPYCDTEYIQLTGVDALCAEGAKMRVRQTRASDYVEDLVAAIEKGAGRKALFLPYGTGCYMKTQRRLEAAIKKYRIKHVGYYSDRKDDLFDSSTSEPFRRYLAKERLEGRM